MIPISKRKKPEIKTISVISRSPVKKPININEIPRWMIFFELILKNGINPFLILKCFIILIKAEHPDKEKMTIGIIIRCDKSPIGIDTIIPVIKTKVIDFILNSFHNEQ